MPLGASICHHLTKEKIIIFIIAAKLLILVLRSLAIYTLCFELSLRYDLLIAPPLYSPAELANPFVQATPFYRAIQVEGLPV